MFAKKSVIVLIVSIIVIVVTPVCGNGQIRLPAVRDTGRVTTMVGTPVELVRTPTHSEFSVKRFESWIGQNFTAYSVSLPIDSLRQVKVEYAMRQLDIYHDVTDLQRQPLAMVALAADQDSLAQFHLGKWLLTPRLSIADRASALINELFVSIDPGHAERLTRAEALLVQVEALPTPYNNVGLKARLSLIPVYYTLGNRSKVIEHSERVLEIILANSDIGKRSVMLMDLPRIQLVQAYAGLPNGMVKIKHFVKRYEEGFIGSSEELVSYQRKHRYPWDTIRAARWAEERVAPLRLLGRSSPIVYAHAVLNTDKEYRSSVPFMMPAIPGTVRLLMFGDMGCGPCKEALPGLERIMQLYKGSSKRQKVEIIYVTKTQGNWGVDLVSPQEEVKMLRDYFKERNLTFPIAIWAGDKEETEEGGIQPKESPNSSVFGVVSTPTFVIIDGNGRIRDYRVGYKTDRSTESEIRKSIDFLLKESSIHSNSSDGIPSSMNQPWAFTSVR